MSNVMGRFYRTEHVDHEDSRSSNNIIYLHLFPLTLTQLIVPFARDSVTSNPSPRISNIFVTSFSDANGCEKAPFCFGIGIPSSEYE